jgi:ABC-type phosphate/phosphonate transport system substrate-binding protein
LFGRTFGWITMGADRVASLPMYDFPELREAHDEFWGALAARLDAAGLKEVPRALTRGASLGEVWGDNRLLFAQGCEYPLAKASSDRVRVVAHPVYAAAGCDGARYRSAIIVSAASDAGVSVGGTASTTRGDGERPAHLADAGVRESDGAYVGRREHVAVANANADGDAEVGRWRHGPVVEAGAGVDSARTLALLRGRRCVVNELDSNSGMNLLRAAVAPLAAPGGRFFGSVVVSGSHLSSVEMVAAGEADVASIDCVSFAHFQRLYASLVSGVRVLAWTASSPSLPYITAGSTSDTTVQTLRAALADVFDDSAMISVRERLLLRGVDLAPAPGFGEVLALEQQAANAGYPVLR